MTPNCWSHSIWKNRCFVIFKSEHPRYGTSFHPGGETRDSIVEMRRYAERMLTEGGPGGDRRARLSIDLLKCMGAAGQ